MVSELRCGVRRIRSVDLAYRYTYVLSNMITVVNLTSCSHNVYTPSISVPLVSQPVTLPSGWTTNFQQQIQTPLIIYFAGSARADHLAVFKAFSTGRF